MFVKILIWFICLFTVGDAYTNKLLDTSLTEQQVKSNQVMGGTAVNAVKRGKDFDLIGFTTEEKERVLKQLRKFKHYQDITMLKECGDSKLIYSCFKYPRKYLQIVNKQQGDINKLGTFPTHQYKDLTYKKRGPTLNIPNKMSKLSAYPSRFNDPLWWSQYQVQDYRTSDGPVMDMNVVPVYNLGFTGKGIKIAIVENGVDVDHEDLKGNNLQDMNYDYCHKKEGCPMAKIKTGVIEYDEPHGTSVAGIICMTADNDKGGVGIAYGANFAGVRITCDSEEIFKELYPATSTDKEKRHNQWYHSFFTILTNGLTHGLDEIDIYNNSWGPEDTGTFAERLHRLAKEAFKKGIKEGRKGKGSIYTFAVGNGKEVDDNCAYDCYSNHVATIGVASANFDGSITIYSEKCSAVFTTAYGGSERNFGARVMAPVPENSYSKHIFGTAFATSMVSGIIALALEANSELTYRDVMHLIARSSEVAPLANNRNTWMKNAAGFWVSSDFGFGLLNAERMVSQALHWEEVPSLDVCSIRVDTPKRQTLSVLQNRFFTFETDTLGKCIETYRLKKINYLEQVILNPHISYPARGAISIYLTSPKGTRSALVEGRRKDISDEGIDGYSFKSLHFWGENPQGRWTIEIATSVMWGNLEAMWTNENNLVENIYVTFFGTFQAPVSKPRTYDAFRLPSHVEQVTV